MLGEVSGTADVNRVFRPTKGTTLVQDLTLLTAVEDMASIEPVDAHKLCPHLEEDWQQLPVLIHFKLVYLVCVPVFKNYFVPAREHLTLGATLPP